MTPATRREFLKGAALAAVAPPALAIAARAAEAPPGHLKLSLAAYSFRDALTGKGGRMDLFDFVDRAAEMGLDAVELTSYYFPERVGADFLHRLKQYAFLAGLDISGTAVGNDFCLPDGPARRAQLGLVRTWIDRAAELDAPVIRIFAGNVPVGDDEGRAIDRAIGGIRESLPYAAERGITLALENHGGITATPDQLLRLARAIDAPNFGINLDTGNFHTDDPYADIAAMAPYAVNVQVKTEIRRKGRPKEDADLARVVQILREARYRGYVVLEYEAEDDPFTAIPRHVRALRELIR